MGDEGQVEVPEEQEAGQPSGDVSQEEQQTGQQPKYVTVDELTKFQEEQFEKLSRLVQSQKDKSEHGIKQWVDEQLARREQALAAAGYRLSPEEREALGKQYTLERLDDLDRGGEAQPPSPRQQVDSNIDDEGTRAMKEAYKILSDVGLHVDPVSIVSPYFFQGDPKGWLEEFKEELAKRTGSAQPEGEPQQVSQRSPTATMPNVGGGSPVARKTLDQLTSELQQLQKLVPTRETLKRRAEIIEEMKRFD